MLQGDLRAFVHQLSKEKGLDPDVVKEAIEEAIVQASKKNLSAYHEARCSLDMETGELRLFVIKEVIDGAIDNPRQEIPIKEAHKINPELEDGDDIEIEIEPEAFGRIAAQSARQFVMQRLREAERNKMVNEYADRVGELVSGEVVRSERRDIIIKMPKGEAALPQKETPHPNRHRPGDRLKMIITQIDPNARGPMVTLSRSHPDLISKLFENEVPEIGEGVVEVLGVAREPGIRSKIAVHSKNPDVDPVGACVGLKGARVQMVVGELEGERIDIVAYDADPAVFIRNALNPAEIVSVSCDQETREADVLVARGNLSLAIGKRGQNARLAAKLTGWTIDIRSEEEASDKAMELASAEIERRYLEDFLGQIEDLTEQHITAFGKQEFNSVAKIAQAPQDRLIRVLGDPELAQIVQNGAVEYHAALQEMQEETGGAPAEEASEEGSADEPGDADEAPAAEETPAEPAEKVEAPVDEAAAVVPEEEVKPDNEEAKPEEAAAPADDTANANEESESDKVTT
jgi:N utilization substance protein A